MHIRVQSHLFSRISDIVINSVVRCVWDDKGHGPIGVNCIFILFFPLGHFLSICKLTNCFGLQLYIFYYLGLFHFIKHGL